MLEVTGLRGAEPIHTAAFLSPPNRRSAHPDPTGQPAPCGMRRPLGEGRSGPLQHGAFGDHTLRHVAPERDEKLPCHRDDGDLPDPAALAAHAVRSEEHTSELQSRQYLVCRLLLEKKKKINTHTATHS